MIAWRAFRFLASQGPAGRAAFAALLDDESPHVRSWVAAQLLSENDARAISVAEQLASEPGLVGFSAQVTLDEYSAGRLPSPFATVSPNQSMSQRPHCEKISVPLPRHPAVAYLSLSR